MNESKCRLMPPKAGSLVQRTFLTRRKITGAIPRTISSLHSKIIHMVALFLFHVSLYAIYFLPSLTACFICFITDEITIAVFLPPLKLFRCPKINDEGQINVWCVYKFVNLQLQLKSSEKRLDNYLVKIKVRGREIRRSNFFSFRLPYQTYLYILLGFIFKVHLYVNLGYQ